MAKLYFRYGAMGSSKTANAVMVQYNYRERGQRVLMLKPKIENRDGATVVRSRCGLVAQCRYVEELGGIDLTGIDCIIVDECHFMNAAQVRQLVDIVDEREIPVICYGLRTDFRGELFEGSRELLRRMAAKDSRVKVILNANNFGHIRSPYNALLQADGDAAIVMCSDLQEPPEMIPAMLREWEAGAKIVCCVKPESRENPLMFAVRRFYYWLLDKFSETPQLRNFTGFGLYDRRFLDALKLFHEPYPYFRGLVEKLHLRADDSLVLLGDLVEKGPESLATLRYAMAMTGFVNHTKLPLRLAVFVGFLLAFLSLLVAAGYLVYKLFYWDTFQLGLAPLVIGLFFFSAVQLIFIGIIGEYVGAIWTQVKNKPLAVEEEKINFDR